MNRAFYCLHELYKHMFLWEIKLQAFLFVISLIKVVYHSTQWNAFRKAFRPDRGGAQRNCFPHLKISQMIFCDCSKDLTPTLTPSQSYDIRKGLLLLGQCYNFYHSHDRSKIRVLHQYCTFCGISSRNLEICLILQ